MPERLDITGYAIVSDDDKIAGADGLTPTSLRNEKDWELYQRAQEVANLSYSAAAATNSSPMSIGTYASSFHARRQDSSSVRTLGGGTRGARPGKKSRPRILPTGGSVAVGGGQVVFDLFLMIGF